MICLSMHFSIVMHVGVRNIVAYKQAHSDSSLSRSNDDRIGRGQFSFPTKIMEESVQDIFLSIGDLQS